MLITNKRNMIDNIQPAKCIDGRKIHKEIQRKTSNYLWAILTILVVIMIIAMLDQFISFSDRILSCLIKSSEDIHILKTRFIDKLLDLCNFIATSHTVLAAAVIFYYGVMDNCKEGIPHRTIMAYSFGTFTIPVLFITSLIFVPLGYIFLSIGWLHIAFSCIPCAYISQVACILLILLSTSFRYVLHAICNVEIRQFAYVMKFNIEQESDDRSTPWIFLMKHMEQAVKSNELMNDKMILLQRLIKVPFYQKERHLTLEELVIDSAKIETNRLYTVYEFYYNNFYAIFSALREIEHNEERQKIYQIIYNFLFELNNECQNSFIDKENNCENWVKNYLATISAIINSVLMSNTIESEEVCIYLLNNCIDSKNIRQKAIQLYFLYHELLFNVNKKAIKLKNISKIDNIDSIKFVDEHDLCVEFWMIWIRCGTSITNEDSFLYLWNALQTAAGSSVDSEPIVFIMHNIQQIRGQNGDDH